MANGTEAAGYGLNPLQSLADTHRAELLASCQSLRTSQLLLQDRPPSFQEHPPPEVGFGQQHTQPAGPSGNGSSDPKSKETPQNFSLLKDFIILFFFSPVAAGKSFPLLLVQVGQNYCRESLRLPSPCAMQSQGRNGFMGTPCCLASDFPPKYGIGKRLEGYGCDLHTALLSSAISLKNQPFNCGHISTSPNLLIIDSW